MIFVVHDDEGHGAREGGSQDEAKSDKTERPRAERTALA